MALSVWLNGGLESMKYDEILLQMNCTQSIISILFLPIFPIHFALMQIQRQNGYIADLGLMSTGLQQ